MQGCYIINQRAAFINRIDSRNAPAEQNDGISNNEMETLNAAVKVTTKAKKINAT